MLFNVTGFRTASGNGITVSTKALQRAQEVIGTCSEEGQGSEICAEEREGSYGGDKLVTLTGGASVTGFQTAGGRAVSVSTLALEKAQAVMKAESKEEDCVLDL